MKFCARCRRVVWTIQILSFIYSIYFVLLLNFYNIFITTIDCIIFIYF